MTRRVHKTRTLIAGGVAIAVAAVGATGAYALGTSSGPQYRTATVTNAIAIQQLAGTGVVQPVTEATVAFPIAGTIAAVDVHAGSHVTVGQPLATLNPNTLNTQMLTQQSALAAAKLTLYNALNGQTAANTPHGNGASAGTAANQIAANTPTTTPTPTATSSANRSGGSSRTGTATETNRAQQQVLSTQHRVDSALAATQSLLQAATRVCAPNTATQPPARTHGPTPVGAITTTTTGRATNNPNIGFGTAACIAAQQQLLTDQQTLSATEQQLAQAERTLDQLITTSTTPTTTSTNTSNTATTATKTTALSTPNAAQLAADQAAVDAAATNVLAAQESINQATITSPISGVVAALSLQAGTQVTASSTTSNVIVVGAGGYEVATTVGVNNIAQIKLGEGATIVPDGTNTTIHGTVVWIGAATTSNTTTTYPVVIGLRGSTTGLRNGTTASTSIAMASSKTPTIVVPTSAVHSTGFRHTVAVLTNGKATTTAVQVGIVGAEQTQITSGLTTGQTVVLADLHAPVPSSNTNVTSTATGLGAALTGGSTNATSGRGTGTRLGGGGGG